MTGIVRETQINMASFHKAQIALLDAYMNGLLDDDEFLVLQQAHKSKNPEFPYEEHGWFSFDELDEVECKAEFRFEKRPTSPCQCFGYPQPVYLFTAYC